jgi:hypothetical protein
LPVKEIIQVPCCKQPIADITMSRITNVSVELDQVVKESNLIVQVECLAPFTEEITVKGIDPNPPFIKSGFDFKVKNVLKNTGKINVPPVIRVPNENWRRSLADYKHIYGDGPSKSYEIKEYETDVPNIKKADILFLHQFQDSFELEVRDAFESMDAIEQIKILIDLKEKY